MWICWAASAVTAVRAVGVMALELAFMVMAMAGPPGSTHSLMHFVTV